MANVVGNIFLYPFFLLFLRFWEAVPLSRMRRDGVFFFFFFLFKKIGNSEGAPGLGSKLESSARGVGKLRERKSERDYYEILSLGVQDGKVDREDKGWNLGDRKS